MAITWSDLQPAGDNNKRWGALGFSKNGRYIIAGINGGRVYYSNDYGDTWEEIQPKGNDNGTWIGKVGISDDGTKILIGEYGGRLWHSTDSGANWTERRPSGNSNLNWRSCAISSDGTVLYACCFQGRFWVSTNSGANWTDTQPEGNNNRQWSDCACSSDGSVVLVTSPGDLSKVYYSTDTGTNWTSNSITSYGVNVSADGNKMIATNYNTRYVYTYSGSTWTARTVDGTSNKLWKGCCINNDGYCLSSIEGGRLYYSDDDGATWTQEQPAGAVDRTWSWLGISTTGDKMIALADSTTNGRVWYGEQTITPTTNTSNFFQLL